MLTPSCKPYCQRRLNTLISCVPLARLPILSTLSKSDFGYHVVITWSPSGYTPVGPDCPDAMSLPCLLIPTWQLVKAHRVTRNQPKIHVIYYTTESILIFEHIGLIFKSSVFVALEDLYVRMLNVTRNLYITIYIYFLDGRLCEVGAVRRGIRIVRRWGLNFSMSGDDSRDNAHSVTTREVSWTAGSFFSVLPSVQFVGLVLPSNSHAEIRTRLHASAISSDIRRLGCVTSAPFGMVCVIVVERK